MRLFAVLLISIIVLGGIVAVCPSAPVDYAEQACPDDCCQPAAPLAPADHLSASLAVCDRLPIYSDGLNLEPMARCHFRPPEAA